MSPAIVLEAAQEEWARVVRDDASGARRIDTYIREGLEWGWRPRYKPQRFEWCGAYAAWCYALAGLTYAIRRKHLASCYRLHKWSQGNARRIAVDDLQPGDIAVVGPEPASKDDPRRLRKQRPRWGRHITIVRRVTGDTVSTVSGNGHGILGDGSYGEGVVRTDYPTSATNPRTFRVLYGVRPSPDTDYDD